MVRLRVPNLAWLRDDLWSARVDVSARAFALLAGFVVAVTDDDGLAAAGVPLLLIGAATVMTWWVVVVGADNPTYRGALVVEGIFTLFLVALSNNAADPFIIYLTAPALLAGFRGGLSTVFALLGAEVLTAVVIQVQQATVRDNFLVTVGPWILTGWAFGLLGAWIRELRLNQRDPRSTPYAHTHRLLAQLRTISRGLPGGLDVRAISEDVLAQTADLTEARHAVLVLIGDDRTRQVVASRGSIDALGDYDHDPVVEESLAIQDAVHGPTDDSPGLFRTSLPMVVGHRTIALMVVDGRQPLTHADVSQLRDLTTESSLRLESALLFHDVRSLATVEERQRLAREIHDGVAQEIGALGYLVDDLARDNCDHNHQAGLQDLRDELTRIVSDLRLSIYDLRAVVSANAGLGAVLGDYVREVGRQTGMTVHLSLEESPERLRADVETELLRIAQEAVNNARKHSGGSNLWVTCRVEPPFAELRVEDDGIGAATIRDGHYGLISMNERAERVNAVLAVTERPGGGTVVSAVLLPPATPHQTGDLHVLQRSAGR